MFKTINKRNCWEIKSCSAGLYIICDAYKSNVNCWEVSKPVCCNKEKVTCLDCIIYKSTYNAENLEK